MMLASLDALAVRDNVPLFVALCSSDHVPEPLRETMPEADLLSVAECDVLSPGLVDADHVKLDDGDLLLVALHELEQLTALDVEPVAESVSDKEGCIDSVQVVVSDPDVLHDSLLLLAVLTVLDVESLTDALVLLESESLQLHMSETVSEEVVDAVSVVLPLFPGDKLCDRLDSWVVVSLNERVPDNSLLDVLERDAVRLQTIVTLDVALRSGLNDSVAVSLSLPIVEDLCADNVTEPDHAHDIDVDGVLDRDGERSIVLLIDALELTSVDSLTLCCAVSVNESVHEPVPVLLPVARNEGDELMVHKNVSLRLSVTVTLGESDSASDTVAVSVSVTVSSVVAVIVSVHESVASSVCVAAESVAVTVSLVDSHNAEPVLVSSSVEVDEIVGTEKVSV